MPTLVTSRILFAVISLWFVFLVYMDASWIKLLITNSINTTPLNEETMDRRARTHSCTKRVQSKYICILHQQHILRKTMCDYLPGDQRSC